MDGETLLLVCFTCALVGYLSGVLASWIHYTRRQRP